MIAATRTTQLRASNKLRNTNPSAEAAKSLQKFSGVPQPARWSSSAATANESAATQSRDQLRSGSTTQTSAKQAGITTSAMNAMSHHFEALHSLSWNA